MDKQQKYTAGQSWVIFCTLGRHNEFLCWCILKCLAEIEALLHNGIGKCLAKFNNVYIGIQINLFIIRQYIGKSNWSWPYATY